MSGPGGAGKGTVVERAVARDPELWLSRSWTTRSQRPGEADDAYVFVDREAFEAHARDDGFLEWAEFLGNLYGTPVPEDVGDHDLVLEIEVQGARQVLARHPEALLVFLDVASPEVQAERLRGRGDPEDLVAKRVQEAEIERQQAAALGAHVLVNDQVDFTVEALAALIDAERDARA